MLYISYIFSYYYTQMITGTLKYLLHSFDMKYIDDEAFIDGLMFDLDSILQLNELEKTEKIRSLKILAKIDINYCPKHSELYYKLSKIPELWSLPSRAGMPLINYICYGYNKIYFDCIYELTKYPELWSMQENDYGHTALHFIILSLKNYGDDTVVPIIENLARHTFLWEITTQYQETPLHILCACKNKMFATVLRYLATNEKLWKYANSKGMTPLHYLCITNDRENALEIFMILSNFKEIWEFRDELDYTPLHLMCRNMVDHKYDEFFSKMRQYPDLWNISNKSGKTPNDLYQEQFVVI